MRDETDRAETAGDPAFRAPVCPVLVRAPDRLAPLVVRHAHEPVVAPHRDGRRYNHPRFLGYERVLHPDHRMARARRAAPLAHDPGAGPAARPVP